MIESLQCVLTGKSPFQRQDCTKRFEKWCIARKATLISSRGCLVDWEEAEGWWGWDLHWSHTRWKHIKNPGAKSRIRIKTWFGITVILLHWNRVDITEGEEAGGRLICFSQCNNSMRHMCLELKKRMEVGKDSLLERCPCRRGGSQVPQPTCSHSGGDPV